jgi:hypothetical protein
MELDLFKISCSKLKLLETGSMFTPKLGLTCSVSPYNVGPPSYELVYKHH